MAQTQELSDVVTEVTLLSGTFFLYPKTKGKYKIKVSNSSIYWEHTVENANSTKSSKHTLSFNDILGCDCMKGKSKSDVTAYLTTYAYPHKKKFASKKTLRKRHTFTFAFDSKETYEANSKDAEQWRVLISCLAKKVPVSSPGM